jgi:hypothetical protein
MTEFELFQALRPFYPAREYALLPQTANGTGAGAFRHCDALALSLWPSRGMHLSGFEIKSHRGDWLRELRNPEKAEQIAQHCNYWWIVAAGPFVKADELPEPWGLMNWNEKKQVLVKTKPAPFREALRPDFPFVAAMLRKAQEVCTPDSAIAQAWAEGRKQGQEEGESRSKFDLEHFDRLKKQVIAFEKASGIKLDEWRDGKAIGGAVNQVLTGAVAHGRETLLGIAKQLVQDLEPTS